MSTESGNRFTTPQRWVLGVGLSLAVVAALVLVYKATAPRSAQTTSASGNKIPEDDVLRVGALPVT